jgi:flagellin FlaB
MTHIVNREEAFTGLEAAIVLIAFVVVAAVFSYVVLGAGFFTTQKSQEVVHSGVAQASSSMEVIGNVYGLNTAVTTPEEVDKIQFSIGTTAGGSGIDMTKVVVTYQDAANYGIIDALGSTYDTLFTTATEGTWGLEQVKGDGDTLLEPNEQFTVTIYPDANSTALTVNKKFTIEMKPQAGGVLLLERTVPGQIDTSNILY